MTRGPLKLDRRQFLKLTGAASALAVPAVLGYGLFDSVRGESPPAISPYAPEDTLKSWPVQPSEASPILLLTNQKPDHPFGAYLAEILRAEGLNCFQVADVSALDSAPLDWYNLVLLAEGPLSSSQVSRLESYVAAGGRLVAMRPDVRLAPLLGVEPVAGSVSAEGYLQVASDHPVGQGIAAETLQFHGTADHYRLAGAREVAWLASDAQIGSASRGTRSSFPAVTLHDYGQGQAAMWAFDLARSVAYTRQGNPAWADQERDGFWIIRTTDLFKDWVDLDRLPIPQADEQQRLLANMLSAMSQAGRPLPRLWYFPGAAQGLLVATSDAHQNSAAAVENVLARVERYGGHMSVYYLPPTSQDWWEIAYRARWLATQLSLMDEAYFPSPAHVAGWRRRGHEFAIHPEVTDGLEASWHRYWRGFTGFGYGPVPPTARTHTVAWTGWVESARLQASYGMRMNLDYYHVGPAFQKTDGEWVYGHLTGSGLPMKFVDQQGRILNIYQQLTQLADDHLLNLHWGGLVKLSAQAAVEVSKSLLRSSLQGHPSAIAAIFHTDPFDAGEQWAAQEAAWMEGTLAYAAEQNIPIRSAAEWLSFTEARHDASLKNIHWQPDTRRLSFDITSQTPADAELTVMAPAWHAQAKLSNIEVDGATIQHYEHTVGGVSYGWVSIGAGAHRVVATYG